MLRILEHAKIHCNPLTRPPRPTLSCNHLFVYLHLTPQVRRAGALAVTKAVADKAQLELLDLDANEIPDSAVGDIRVRIFSMTFMPTHHCLQLSCNTVAEAADQVMFTCTFKQAQTCRGAEP